MRIVLDTNVLVRGNARARGPARELLQLIVGSPNHTLLLSPFPLQELERVFSYERARVSSKPTDEEIAEYLSYLRAKDVSEVVFPVLLPASFRPTPMMTPSFTRLSLAEPMPFAPLNRDFYNVSVLKFVESGA
jgi:hypothetical protein